MTRALGLAVLATVFGLWAAARAAGPPPAAPPDGDPQVVELLSGVDYVPPRNSIDDVLGGAAPDDLIEIARSSAPDTGLRLRAYRALALYPSAETSAALRDALVDHGAADQGIDTVYLRAAMDSLARVDGAAAVPDLTPLLDHASRDVRAAVAAALALTGSPDAISPLRDRLAVEPVDQVRLAIAEALRQLE